MGIRRERAPTHSQPVIRGIVGPPAFHKSRGKLVSVAFMLSLDEYQRLLARLEYRMEQPGEDFDADAASWSTIAWQGDMSLVRCPLCRKLSLASQVVRKLHADVRREPCSICLSHDSEVCFACGHLCVCHGCFDGLVEHQAASSTPRIPWREQRVLATTIGSASLREDLEEGDLTAEGARRTEH
eukprot:TRINITY_DN33735_c0_g1_i3.p1 TRINITY_DN33735_c0_g1~~TRINITY_DN33735_c0_g1_i3.p1  ORF type:complete len:184 (-),score=20.81 TRINITY_DN33735_c0_g1_i3:29-580(-)